MEAQFLQESVNLIKTRSREWRLKINELYLKVYLRSPARENPRNYKVNIISVPVGTKRNRLFWNKPRINKV